MESIRARVAVGVTALVVGAGALTPTVAAAESVAKVQVVKLVGATKPIPAAEHAISGSVYFPLNGYISYSSAGYSLTAPAKVLAQVPAASLSNLQQYLQTTNSDIKAGTLVMGANGVAGVPATKANASLAEPNAVATPDARWTGKHGYIETHWYGLKVKLDSYLTGKVIAGLGLGSGVSWLEAELGGGRYAGAVAAALAVAAASVYLCQHSNGNTYLYFINLPVYTWGCNPFG